MIQSSAHLFEEVYSGMVNLIEELARPHLRNNFTANNVDVQLALTDNYVILFDSINQRTPTHFCKLDFEVKFEMIYQP